VTPKGVEHALFGENATAFGSRVITSVTPKGVEHAPSGGV